MLRARPRELVLAGGCPELVLTGWGWYGVCFLVILSVGDGARMVGIFVSLAVLKVGYPSCSESRVWF